MASLQAGKRPNDFPEAHYGRQFIGMWDRLSTFGDVPVLLDGQRIVVPQGNRKEILQRLHIPQTGITKTRKAAGELYFSPGISSDIKNMIDCCQTCQESRPSSGLVFNSINVNAPMDKIGVDLF